MGLLAAMLIVALWAETASTRSLSVRSIDLVVLSCERVGLVRVVAIRDSGTADVDELDRFIEYRAVRWLVGYGPTRGKFNYHPSASGVCPTPGDTLLVLHELTMQPGAPIDTVRVVHVMNMTHSDGVPFSLSFTADSRLLKEPDAAMEIVERRAARIQAGRPLGDDRHLSPVEFALGQGAIDIGMIEDSEAERATSSGSANELFIPADAESLPMLMARTRASSADLRAWAALRLAPYPRDSVIARLRQMLKDDGAYVSRKTRSDGGIDSTWIPYVRNAALTALHDMKADTTTAGRRRP